MKDLLGEHKRALDAYAKDFNELRGMGDRLCNWLGELRDGKRRPDRSAFRAELKTISAQLDKIEESMNQAQARYHARVDTINQGVVQKFRGLCSYAEGTGQSTAGTRLLLDECEDFEKAKGNFAERKALFDGVLNIANSLADSTRDKTEESKVSRDVPTSREKFAIYEQFMAMPDGEGKGAFYKENRAVILAVENFKRIRI